MAMALTGLTSDSCASIGRKKASYGLTYSVQHAPGEPC